MLITYWSCSSHHMRSVVFVHLRSAKHNPGMQATTAAFQPVQIVRLRELAVSGGILPEFAGRLAPVRDIAQWLAATTHLLERLLRSTAGNAPAQAAACMEHASSDQQGPIFLPLTGPAP